MSACRAQRRRLVYCAVGGSGLDTAAPHARCGRRMRMVHTPVSTASNLAGRHPTMSEDLDNRLLGEHLEILAERWAAALEFAGFDAAIVTAGAAQNYFLDDQAPPFRANPHFAQWFPEPDCAGSVLLIRQGEPCRLYFCQPDDYWHQPPSTPGWAERHFALETFADPADLQTAVSAAAAGCNRLAYVGEHPPGDLAVSAVNPGLLIDHLHYQRAYKTGFELACMRAATDRAVAGHVAARDAFRAGASEFEIHMAYLAASRQTSDALPYPNIIALNGHGAVLHYQHYDRLAPDVTLSFLIDAGGRYRGYAADVTRTYAAQGTEHTRFAALVEALDQAQQQLIREIRPGLGYVSLHESAHRAVAAILCDQQLLRCTPEEAFERGISRTFLPHGLGHLIGLQTHDVGGLQRSAEGGLQPPPEAYPALRMTRSIEPGQVFTIEPGLYFIPQLLAALRQSDAGRLVRWSEVDALTPYGGIRIEDNVFVTADGVDNLTRTAFARHG